VTAPLFLFSFAWFLLHANPTVYFGDCGELLCDVLRGFVPHPTGFPAYLLTAAPFASLGPFAINLHSSFFAALSVTLLYHVSERLLLSQGFEKDRARNASLAASAALLGSCTLTLHASCARVYTLQLALLLSGMLWTLSYRKTPRWALGVGLLLGFASGTHTLFLTLLPFAVIYLWKRLRQPWTLLPWFAGGSLLGASVHLCIPLRSALHPIVDWGTPSTFEAWWRYITQSGYEFKMLARGGEGTRLFLSECLRFGGREWSLLIWIFAAFGFYALCRVNRNLAAALGSVLLLNVLLMYLYGGEFDLNVLYRYFLPAYAVLALWAGQSWAWFSERSLFVKKTQPWGEILALSFYLLACLWIPGVRWKDLPRSTDAWHYAVNLLRSIPRGATLEVASDAQIPPLAYARYVRGMRSDLRMLDWYGTMFPDTVRRMRQNPGLTKEIVEKEFLDEGGGLLFLPSHRGVAPPYECRSWGLSHRLTDRPLAHDGEPPALRQMCFRLTDAEYSDIESQNTLGAVFLQRADRARELNDIPQALADLGDAAKHCSLAPNILVDTAVAYGKTGAPDKVEPLLLQALRLRPNHYTGNVNLGLYYASRGLYLRSMQHLQIAAHAVPNDPLAPQLMRQVQAMMEPRP